MARQEEKAPEPTVTFTAKAGLPSDPKTMEVHAAFGNLEPWDLDSWPRFEQVGKRHPRIDGRRESDRARSGPGSRAAPSRRYPPPVGPGCQSFRHVTPRGAACYNGSNA